MGSMNRSLILFICLVLDSITLVTEKFTGFKTFSNCQMLTVQPCMYFSEMKEFSKIALDVDLHIYS